MDLIIFSTVPLLLPLSSESLKTSKGSLASADYFVGVVTARQDNYRGFQVKACREHWECLNSKLFSDSIRASCEIENGIHNITDFATDVSKSKVVDKLCETTATIAKKPKSGTGNVSKVYKRSIHPDAPDSPKIECSRFANYFFIYSMLLY
jgi:hypothetical protein